MAKARRGSASPDSVEVRKPSDGKAAQEWTREEMTVAGTESQSSHRQHDDCVHDESTLAETPVTDDVWEA